MEQVDSTELHLSRVKELAGLADNARDVVKEEVILDGPTHQLETKMRLVTSSNENSGGNGSGGGGNVVSVPVSLPIGSMISSTAFNVLGPEHHFKQMLCVDNNGYISGGTVVGNMGADLKTIVIQQHQQPHHQQQHQQQQHHHQQQQQQHHQQQQQHGGNGSHAGIAGVNHGDGSGSNNSHDSLVAGDHTQQTGAGNVGGGGVSWSETTHMEIFPIRCKTTNAELYRSKLGSGGRGRCVKFKDKWYTPSEFENVCGRGSSKDWKRSIKYAGKSLQSLIDEGALTPHATNCSCTVCCDDEAASGPVRLFTPYKRRKRNQTDMDVEAGPKRKRNNNNNHNQNNNNNNTNNNNNNSETTQTTTIVDDNNMFLTEDNITSKDEPWPTLNDSLDTPTELVDQSQMQVHPYDRETFVVNINDPGSLALLDTSQAMKSLENVYCTMVKATNDFKRIMNDIKSVYERKIEILQKERDAAVAAMRVQVHTDIDDPNISGSLHGNEIISAKKCANCDREALAECSLCRKTPYCSEFCQRKDWHSHQVVCSRSPQAATQQIMLLVDEQP